MKIKINSIANTLFRLVLLLNLAKYVIALHITLVVYAYFKRSLKEKYFVLF